MSVTENREKQYLYQQPEWVVLGCVVIFFGIILHVYFPNLGGAGFSLPLNIISAFFLALFVLLASFLQIKKKGITYSIASNFISLGLIILMALCFFSPDNYRYNAYLTAYWILGILIFYQGLIQFNISSIGREIILCGILIAATIESILAMLQVFNLLPVIGLPYPPLNGDRPYGVFQQVNVFSSFTCVGIASAVGLLIKIKNVKWPLVGFITTALVLMSATLPLSQSLTGYLNLFFIFIVFYLFAKYYRKRILFVFAFVILGLIIGYGIKNGLNIIDATESKLNTSRIRWVLWQHSLYLFSEKPLLGWGVGSFESVFLERFGGSLLETNERIMSHPHNEILRWMVEGGFVGLVATVLVIIGGVVLLLSTFKNKNENYIYCVVALPIVFHMMTEFPLWLSMPHGIVLILLLRCADSPNKEYKLNNMVSYFSKGTVIFCSALSVVLLFMAFQAQQYLTYIEKTGQQTLLSIEKPAYHNFNYLLIYDRYLFDLNMGYLLHYNETQDVKYLNLFNDWAMKASSSSPDINIYVSWILVLNELGEKDKAREVRYKASYLFGENERLNQLNF